MHHKLFINIFWYRTSPFLPIFPQLLPASMELNNLLFYSYLISNGTRVTTESASSITDVSEMSTITALYWNFYYLCFFAGAYVLQVKATDADDPTYGNSARVVYSILQGQPYFSIDPKTGKQFISNTGKFNLWISIHVGNISE